MITLADHIAGATFSTINHPTLGAMQSCDIDGWGFRKVEGGDWESYDDCGFLDGAQGLEIPEGEDLCSYATQWINARQLGERISQITGVIRDWY